MPSNQTPNYALNQWERDDRILMDDFNADNAKIDAVLGAHAGTLTAHTEALTKLGNCRIEVFDYVGTGTFGQNNPTVLNFSARPVFFLIVCGSAIYYGFGLDETQHAFLGMYYNDAFQTFGFTRKDMHWVGSQLRILGEDARRQMNGKDYEYRVLAFYAEDGDT